MATATQRAEEADPSGVGEVSLGQKMLSAVSGSVLTSLLGMLYLYSSNMYPPDCVVLVLSQHCTSGYSYHGTSY